MAHTFTKSPIHTVAGALAVLALGTGSTSALATVITHNVPLSTEVIMGDGIFNGGWTVGTMNNIEVGLRAKTRLPSPLNDSETKNNGAGTYGAFDTGPARVADGDKVSWNYEFSVNINADGTDASGRKFLNPIAGTPAVSDLAVLLFLDIDPTAGVDLITIDPLTFWNDNEYGNNMTAAGAGDSTSATNAARGFNIGANLVQNSQNLGFLDKLEVVPGIPSPYFNMDRGDATWDFALQVRDSTGILAETSMTVIVGKGGAPVATVPEPGSFALLGLGLLGALGLRRRRLS